MAQLAIAGVSKAFGSFRAVDGVSLDVQDGEFLAVLGPSGCGKTTLLRLIAGFEKVSEGSIRIGDRTMSSLGAHVAPEERRVGIVFQSYALWPHMTVEENVGYSLKVAGVPRSERDRRVTEALAMVHLDGFAQRRTAQLSGGQRQRVALARCLVAAPSLVLLDEPLANLDVHLRASMEDEFTEFHRRTGTTMFYITHDQAEAMALADRIAVMDGGRIVQVAKPVELYREPATEMVASFIGQGMVVAAEVRSVEGGGECHARILGADFRVRCPRDQRPALAALAALHPRELELLGAHAPGIAGHVRRLVYRGGYRRAEIAAVAAPETVLQVDVPEGVTLGDGASVRVGIADGWIIPAAAAGINR